jgi:hypothetical protein
VVELWPGWPAGGGADQCLAGSGGGVQYLAGSSDGGHIRGCPTVGDPSHDIIDVGPV